MAVSVTNRKSFQSLRAQSVTIKLDTTDAGKLNTINEGMKATTSNGKIGYVCRVDKYGHSFEVNPAMPINNLASDSTPGYIRTGETLTLE